MKDDGDVAIGAVLFFKDLTQVEQLEERERLRDRRTKEAETLASLTGWSMPDIRQKMGPDGSEVKNPRPWYRKLWAD